MTQNGSYIDFIHDIYLALFSCRLRRSSDNDSVYQFVAHFTGKFGRFEVFFDVPYKLIRALYCVFRFCKFCFYFCDFCSSEYFCIKPMQISSGIFPFTLSS